MPNAASVVPPPVHTETSPEAGRDPLSTMIEIAENDKLSDQDKTSLIEYSKKRFKHRRFMAYIALWSVVISLALLFVVAFIDGFIGSSILHSIKENQALITWIEGFLTAIVAAYFGISAWRPAS